jgi:DNA-directed RNA polymerase
MKLWLRKETGRLDRRRQASGISPNFVHSMDAAALRLYVLLAKDNGIDSFALVHDSYGTLAADTDISAACLREAFVDMYVGKNHLEALRGSMLKSIADDAVSIPPVPLMGTLDLEQVRQADYFFA